jgi:hypothetical protein
MCAELADLAMQLARAAAARALAGQAEPDQPPSITTAEPPAGEPPAPQPLQAVQPPHTRQTAPRATPAPRAQPVYAPTAYRPTDPALLFTRLAAVVRDCITLEARLAGGLGAGPAQTSRARPQPLPADPRRTLLREILTRATVNHPERIALNREIAARVDEHLQADPDQTLHPTEILEKICNEFQIEPDWANLPDEFLDAICEGLEDPGAELDPRATSPP